MVFISTSPANWTARAVRAEWKELHLEEINLLLWFSEGVTGVPLRTVPTLEQPLAEVLTACDGSARPGSGLLQEHTS